VLPRHGVRGQRRPRRARPRRRAAPLLSPVAAPAERTRAVGIDIGGTKMLGVVVDAADPTAVVTETRRPTPVGAAALVDGIAELVEELDPGGAGPVGLGIPGLIDDHDVFRFGANLPGVVDLAVGEVVG